MFRITHKGNFNNTERFLTKAKKLNVRSILEKYGDRGVQALSSATPKDTGLTAASWKYSISVDSLRYNISWYNTNISNGVQIAILIQYGHGTGNGGYVQPNDYINPAMRPIFESMAEEIWKEVSSL